MKKPTVPRNAPPVEPTALLAKTFPEVAVPLAPPDLSSPHSLESCLFGRRSTRYYSEAPLSLAETGQLVWAAQGVTGLGGLRTAPSAGALYPLRTYLVAGNVTGLASGVYRYDPDGHSLKPICAGDQRERLVMATMGQECAGDGAAAILLAANYARGRREFGDAAEKLTLIETGHAAQNLCLQATALGLGVIGLGKFDVDLLREILHIPDKEDPLYLLVTGHKQAV